MEEKNREHQEEIVSLNLEDLDIEELEQRLEMASAAPNADCWVHDNCGADLAASAA